MAQALLIGEQEEKANAAPFLSIPRTEGSFMFFRNVVIFGAGTMGHAIALRFANGGAWQNGPSSQKDEDT